MCSKVIKTIAVWIVSSSECGSSPLSGHFHVRQFCGSVVLLIHRIRQSHLKASDRIDLQCLKGKERSRRPLQPLTATRTGSVRSADQPHLAHIERGWATIEPLSPSFRYERLARVVFQATRAALIDRRDANICRIENAKAEAGRRTLPSITAALSWKRSDLVSEVD
jgi:hypothetical protein